MKVFAALFLLVAQAGSHEVTMPGQFYAPGRLDVLVGDTVTWRNTDHATHTITADDGSFDSGPIGPGAAFDRAFPVPGTYRFHCTIHRFMHGVVSVYHLVLRGPPRAVVAGGTATLIGLAPPDAEVVLERGAAVVARTRADREGRFSFTVAAERGAPYRARSGAATSAPLSVPVAPKVTLTAAGGALRVATQPSLARATVVFEVWSRERFAWQRYRTVPLGRRVLVPKRAVRARVLAVDGYTDGISNVLRPVRGHGGH